MKAIVPAVIGVVIMEVIVHLPGFEWLDSIELDQMLRQLPILVVGVVLYISTCSLPIIQPPSGLNRLTYNLQAEYS